jgi:hypothetical protein
MDTPVDIVDRIKVVEVEHDTCDRCGPSVKAFVYAKMHSGVTLSYCAHCGTRFWEQLNAQASTVIDLRYMVGFA